MQRDQLGFFKKGKKNIFASQSFSRIKRLDKSNVRHRFSFGESVVSQETSNKVLER